jgi:hypothetical protein
VLVANDVDGTVSVLLRDQWSADAIVPPPRLSRVQLLPAWSQVGQGARNARLAEPFKSNGLAQKEELGDHRRGYESARSG